MPGQLARFVAGNTNLASTVSEPPPRTTPRGSQTKVDLMSQPIRTIGAGVLGALIVAVAAPALPPASRSRMLRLGTRLQFLFFAVLLPVLAGEAVKWMAGRGRPFVGGKADAFNFAPFQGTEAFASFPSGHAVTAFARAGKVM